MKIAVIAAMSKELALLLPLVGDHATVNVNGITFHTGTVGEHELILVQSGIGKVNAAVTALTLIENFHPALVINSGVAGGVGVAGILDVVIPDRVAYHDVWCGPDTEPGQAAGMPLYFECALPAEVAESLGARRGVLASGDIFVSSPEEVAHIRDMYPDAVAVDMESAAIAQVCHIKSVPFVCVRVISDTPGESDNIAQYEDFWTAAPAGTFRVLRALIQRL